MMQIFQYVCKVILNDLSISNWVIHSYLPIVYFINIILISIF